jgi:cytochrome c-type biogenesis protein CcmH
VLSSPPKTGFNLVAWLLPFAAILGGGVVIYLALKAWVRRGSGPPTDDSGIIEEKDEAYRQQLEKELDEFGEEGFR